MVLNEEPQNEIQTDKQLIDLKSSLDNFSHETNQKDLQSIKNELEKIKMSVANEHNEEKRGKYESMIREYEGIISTLDEGINKQTKDLVSTIKDEENNLYKEVIEGAIETPGEFDTNKPNTYIQRKENIFINTSGFLPGGNGIEENSYKAANKGREIAKYNVQLFLKNIRTTETIPKWLQSIVTTLSS